MATPTLETTRPGILSRLPVARRLRLPAPDRPPPFGANFSKLWAATAVSNLGDGVRDAALPLLAATLTRDPALVAGVAVAGRLPWLLVSLVSGAIVDRVDRRRLMAAANLFRAAAVGLLVVSSATGMAQLPLVYVVAFALGVAETLFDNAFLSITPAVVPRSRLEAANGRLEAAMVVCNEFAGPPLGGVLFAIAATVPFALDGASFAVSALLILSMRGTFRPVSLDPPARRSIRSEIGEGLRWLWSHRFLRSLSAMAAVVNLLLTATLSIFVLFALEVLGSGELGYGLTLSAFGGGGLIGGLAAAAISRRVGAVRTITGIILLAAASQAVLGLSSDLVLAAGMIALVSFSGSVWSVLTNSLRQGLIPDRLLGRVTSAHRLLSFGAMPLGALLGGLVGRSLGLRAPFLLAAVGLAVLGLAARRLLGPIPIPEPEAAEVV